MFSIFFSEHKSIDFSNILFDDDTIQEPSNIIIVLIRKSHTDGIVHSLPVIDRCCKWSGWDVDVRKLKFDGRDETRRISCDISKPTFLQEYVMKRKFVMLNFIYISVHVFNNSMFSKFQNDPVTEKFN